MAELNFGLLTPPGSQNIGNAFVQGMDQAAVARAQENQNALAQYQLSAAKRTDQVQNAINNAYQNAINPDGSVNYSKVNAALAAGGAGAKIPEAEAARRKAELDAVELSIRQGILGLQPTTLVAANTKLVDDKLKQSRSMLEGVTTPEQYIAWHEANHNDPILGKALAGRGVTMEQSRARINAALQQPGGLAQLINESRLGVEKFAELNRPQNVQQSMGGSVRTLSIPGMGGNATVVPGSVGTVTPGPGTVPAIIQADIATARALDEGIPVPGVAPAPVTPAAAPAQPGAQVTPAAFPRITPQVQATRNAEQIALLNAELVNSNPADQQRIRAEIAKLSTGKPFAAAGANPLPVVNNMPGAVAVNAMNAPPAAAAPGAYSPKMLRDMALKGMQPDGKGGQTFIPGGPADPVVKQRVATAQAVGAQIGKNNAIALEKLPNAIATGKELIRKLDEILGDANVVDGQVMYNKAPAAGFDSAFGPTGIIARAYPSSEAAAFQARVKEILGGAFLEAYETLRGAQGITDIEGKKATEARTRMGFNLSKTEFIIAAREYRKTAAEALARSETRLKSLQSPAAPAQTDQAALDWAAANPSDPRAAQIQQRNGVR